MKNKKRRPFVLKDAADNKIARGVEYEQGNVQVLWREDLGWGGEQYYSLANVLDLMPNVVSFHWEE